MKRRYFPAALNVRGKRCLVIGSDTEAADKSQRLAESGALVTVISHGPPAPFAAARAAGVTIEERPYADADIDDQFLVVLAIKTDPALTKAVADRCRARRVLLSAVDQPAFCDVVHVSLFERGALQIAISTDGRAPALSRRLREELTRAFDGRPIEAFLDHLSAVREKLEREEPDLSERRRKLIAAAAGFRLDAAVRFPADWPEPR